jgi:excisionase family DNA binding protein
MSKLEELREVKAGLITPEQAAEILEVKPSTLEKWRVTGRVSLPYVKVGRRVLYRAADVMAFLEPTCEVNQNVRRRRHHTAGMSAGSRESRAVA